MSTRVRWLPLVLVAALALVPSPPAAAQAPPRVMPIAPDITDSLTRRVLRVLNTTPLMIERLRPAGGPARGPYSSHLIPPLNPARAERLRRAMALCEQGRRDLARDSLRALNADVPHHAEVVSELGRTLQLLEAWGELARFARAERLASADSALLGRELALAEERLGHPTEAALVAIEVWAASPLEARWAATEVQRLMPADAGRTREALRRAIARDPQREDIARGLARLDWRANDEAAMLRTLAAVDRPAGDGAVRWSFAEELVQSGVPRDSSAALDVLIALCGERTLRVEFRQAAARRAWEVAGARAARGESAARITHTLADVPRERWDGAFALEIARALRESGRTSEARALLAAEPGSVVTGDLALERALADLRDGPPARALPALHALAATSDEAAFQYAEALFFAGECDSALSWHLRVAGDPAGARTGAALERAYLLEDAQPREGLPALAAAFYAAWRGDARASDAICDSLYLGLPRGTLWVQVALLLSSQRESAGDAKGALAPLLAVADSLPGDRLAPLARQRAGDLYRDHLHDDALAIAQYEACLIRYPRAWNAPEVRRALEKLRGERRL